MLRLRTCKGLLLLAAIVLVDASQVHSQSPAQKPASAEGSPSLQNVSVEATQQNFLLMQMLEQLPPYRPVEKLSGRVVLSGSRTMSDLGHQWAENFKQFHPELEFSGTAEGSEIALKMLADDPKIIAGVSRPVDEKDQKILQAGKCKQPIAITVGVEAMALFVHKTNPLPSVSSENVKAIFAATKDGKPKAKVWGDLGVQSGLSTKPVNIYERESGSGSRVFISRSLLGGAEVTSSFTPCNSSTEICKAIGMDPQGIGFADLNYEHPDVRRVPLLVNGEPVEANEANVLAGKYPILRPLMLVLDKEQLVTDGKIRESVLRYVLSRDGQLVVMKSGFYPLDLGFIHSQMTELFGQQLR